jgi:hypothetical protein
MEHQETHHLQHSPLNSIDDGIAHPVMGLVSPPRKNVGPDEDIRRESVFRLVQGRGPDFHGRAETLPQRRRQDRMNAVRIDLTR